MAEGEKLGTAAKKGLDSQIAAWTELYKDAGWECDRLLEGAKTSGDFYGCEIVQIKLDQLYKHENKFEFNYRSLNKLY